VNLCRPDNEKSCAACCGLYNVPDGTRPTLLRRLRTRARAFGSCLRSPEALLQYQRRIRSEEAVTPLDPEIHVCEFAGFVDADRRIVGCLLHPSSPGNDGVDLRGLCHYGKMACNMFFCPAWEELEPERRTMLVRAVKDWHLYGLVINDLDFLDALFGLMEIALGGPPESPRLASSPASQVFEEMVRWKDAWPFKGVRSVRRSRYYFKRCRYKEAPTQAAYTQRLLECLGFTFDLEEEVSFARDLVADTLARFSAAYREVSR
jgi:hypothetical protein